MIPHDTQRKTLLVVDDQEQNLRILGTILTMMGYDLVPALDGKQALQRLAARIPDLILLDIILPDIDGVALCRKIKENPAWAEIPIIFVSASDDKNLVVQALETGGVDYVTKPYNKAELISRVRAHLALKESRDALKNIAEDKDVLLGMLAHDFKSHLSGVMMSARMLSTRETNLSDRSGTLIKEIAQSSERMLEFVQRFLANQEAAASAALKPHPIDVVAVARQVLRQHQDQAALKNIRLHCTLPEQAVPALGDAAALRQILDNLLSNSVKFIHPAGEITLDIQATPSQIFITVADNGPGFTEDDRAHLYQRYRRLSATSTGSEPSSGLGLSIARALAKKMNGSLELISPPGSGAHFRIGLPPVPNETTHPTPDGTPGH